MNFRDDSEWNEKNELKAFLIFKKLQELDSPRGKQMELCKKMEKETNLEAGNISAKVSNYKSVAGINFGFKFGLLATLLNNDQEVIKCAEHSKLKKEVTLQP